MSHKKGHRCLIPVGPYHPLQEEPEFFQLYVEGETVVDMDWRTSYNHRGIEELATHKTFDQVPFLVERVCGICSASHPLAYVQAVEDIGKIEVPERALYLRSLVNELERIHSHVLWFGLAGHFIGYNTVFMWAWRYRDPILDLLEMTTGSRINYANARVGGVRRDIDNAFMPEIIKGIDEFLPPLDMLIKAVLDDPVLHARLKGIGILTKEDAIKYAVAGPTARASGVPIDVRRDDPYAAYDLVDWDVITQEEGDVFAKVVVRLLECVEAARIIKQCAERLPQIDGPICAEVREIPAGEGVGHVEAPRGETFHYVRSDGSPRPVRHKIRAPSFNNVPSFKASCIGYTVSDVTITLASIDPCYSCTERMARVVDRKSGEEILTFADLVKLSQEKTKRIKEEMGV
ncbi:MAG: NADH:ubiquinone oxidoreductase [Planctomycetes bacterium DG_23]|nr:MAG: NADH:ubiquinone oxidoreductase [Planctomycetes bacterium DG_23]